MFLKTSQVKQRTEIKDQISKTQDGKKPNKLNRDIFAFKCLFVKVCWSEWLTDLKELFHCLIFFTRLCRSFQATKTFRFNIKMLRSFEPVPFHTHTHFNINSNNTKKKKKEEKYHPMWPMSLFPGFGFMVLEQSAQFNESFYHCFTKKKKKIPTWWHMPSAGSGGLSFVTTSSVWLCVFVCVRCMSQAPPRPTVY